MIQQEGPGWRLAHDPAREPFCVLIGGTSWAFELTAAEWRCLVDLVVLLQDQHSALVDQLMEEESISIEAERGPWWVGLDGDRQRWALSVVLAAGEGRGAEGHWEAPAAEAMAAAMRTNVDLLL